MSDTNTQLVRRFFDELCNGRRTDSAGELCRPDFAFHDPQAPPVTGPDGIAAHLGIYHDAVDAHWDLTDLIPAGEHVIARWTATGTHRSELMGIAPTGRSIEVQGISIFRAADGQLAEEWSVWDALGLLQQLGAIPVPA